jgi:hypothetical protein
MALNQDGSSTAGYSDVDSLFAQGVRSYPIPANHFRAAYRTASLAFTNGVNISSIHNPGPSPMAIFKLRAKVKPMAIWTPAAAGLEVALSFFIGRSWSVLGTTGRTALTLSGNNQKMRTAMGTTSANIGFANGIGGITGDTITQDANAIALDTGSPQTHSTTAAASPGAGVQDSVWCEALFQANIANGEYPIILAQNEGIRLVYNIVGTAAAVIIPVEVVWAEMAAFPRGD